MTLPDESNIHQQNTSLHTLQDPNAISYINENCQENIVEEPLLPDDERHHGYHVGPGPLFVPNQYYSHQQSYNSRAQEYILNSEPLGRFAMSPVRRMFCLLALFDCLMTFIMWIIYLQLAGGVLKQIKQEVVNYIFHESYFDIVATAFARAVFLLLFYSCLCKSKRWHMIAFTTAATTIFLIVKVFYNEFEHGAPMNYLLIIFSFVICWCEAWHFDYQVLPLEVESDKLAVSIPGVVDSFGGRSSHRFPRGPKSGTYFTPYAGSIYQAQPLSETSSLSNISEELNETQHQDKCWVHSSKQLVHDVMRMLYINDGWVMERSEKDNITVYSRNFDGIGKVFKLETLIDVPSLTLDNLIWEEVNSQPTWNASVKDCHIVRRINRKTDILYSITAEVGSGVIASRDFVSLRRRKKEGPLTLLCAKSIQADEIPEKQSIIRGYNGPGGWILRDIPDEPCRTEFSWLLNTDIKGWLPTRLVEQSLSGVMVDTTRDIRKHVTQLSA